MVDITCCHQSVKDKNFESNSQLVVRIGVRIARCHQSVKDKNSESTESAKFVLSTPFSPLESTKPGVFVLSKPKAQMCKMRQKQLSLPLEIQSKRL